MTENKKIKHPLKSIYFYLTEDCNLKCRHCWLAPGYQPGITSDRYLSFDLFRSILNQARQLGLSDLKLTGGEPLLHPQIADLLNFVRKEDLRLSLETNGVLCTPELSEKIKSCKEPFVSVSLDGSTAETHEWVRGVKGCFAEALDGIRNLSRAGIKPQIIMSIMHHNKHQLEELVQLAVRLGAASVKFNIVNPITRGKKMYLAGEVPDIEELIDLGEWVENDLSKSYPLDIHYSHPMAFQPLGKILGNNGTGCSACGISSILGVLSDGSYALCGIGESVQELIFGNAGTDNLIEIWNRTAILNDIRSSLTHKLEGICGKCLLITKCSGYCIAQNYFMSKNLYAPFWYCESAYEKGLFPLSRLKE